MPHLEIEYTDNLPGVDPRGVLTAAMSALSGLGLYDMPTCKGRIRRLATYAVDHPDSGLAFVAVRLSVLPGKTPDERSRTSQALTDAVAAALAPCRGTQVRTEVREIAADAYTGRDL